MLVLGVAVFVRYSPHLLCPTKDVEARAQDLQAQGQSSTAAVEALRMELEESRRVLSDLQVSHLPFVLDGSVPLPDPASFPVLDPCFPKKALIGIPARVLVLLPMGNVQ